VILSKKMEKDNMRLHASNSNPVSFQIETPNPSARSRGNLDLPIAKRRESRPLEIDEFDDFSTKRPEGESILAHSGMKERK